MDSYCHLNPEKYILSLCISKSTFRACETPACSERMRWIFSCSSAYRDAISADRSLEPSSTMTISKFSYVCAKTDCTQRSEVLLHLIDRNQNGNQRIHLLHLYILIFYRLNSQIASSSNYFLRTSTLINTFFVSRD